MKWLVKPIMRPIARRREDVARAQLAAALTLARPAPKFVTKAGCALQETNFKGNA